MTVEPSGRLAPAHSISSNDHGDALSRTSVGMRLLAGLHWLGNRPCRPGAAATVGDHEEPIRAETFSIDLMPARMKAAPVVIVSWEAPATHGANAAERP